MSERAVIGVDLGATRIKAGLVTGNQVVTTLVEPLDPKDRTSEGVVERLVSTVQRLQGERDRRRHIDGVGIGVPGVIRHAHGVVAQSPNFPAWKDLPLADLLRERLSLPVILDNDANVVTLGEARFGAGRGVGDFALLTLGSGVGGGLFLCGDVYRGAEGMAGEIGHMVVEPDGPPCGCGGRGCLEQYASFNALRAFVLRDRLFGDLTEAAVQDPDLPQRLFLAAQSGDARCRAYFEEMGRRLAVAIGNLLNLLNLRLVILAGGIARAFPAFSPALFDAIRGRAFPAVLAAAHIVPCALWEEAGILGASALVRS